METMEKNEPWRAWSSWRTRPQLFHHVHLRKRPLAAGALRTPATLIRVTPLDPGEEPHRIRGFHGPEVHPYSHEMWVLLYSPAAAVEGPPTLSLGSTALIARALFS